MKSTTGWKNDSITASPEQGGTGSLTSWDGTAIGYRQLGHGPGVILVQGAMGTAQNFLELAQDLADAFTVYLPDRRGRGLSPLSYSPDYHIQKDVEDLEALLAKTGAHNVFGLSSGAVIVLQAALTLPSIDKAAVYEPALFIHGAPKGLTSRLEQEIAGGRTAAALITGMKGAQMGPRIFNLIPGWLLEPLTNSMLKSEDAKGSGAYASMRELAPALQYDFKIVEEMSDQFDTFKAIRTKLLLLGGSKSPAFLKAALDALEKVLPGARRVEFPGLGHGAAWNADRFGQPGPVAEELRRFFA